MKTEKIFTNSWTALLVICAIVIAVWALSGCSSESGKLNQIPFEKVVIKEYIPLGNTTQYNLKCYKVLRLKDSTKRFIRLKCPDGSTYNIGDTTVYKFTNE